MSVDGGIRNAKFRQSGKKLLVCFAVKEEAAPFRKAVGTSDRVRIVVTGMGERNARTAFERAISQETPDLVVTCGFAGGLRPGLAHGTVLYECDGQPDLAGRLQKGGALRGKFVFSGLVASTAAEKRVLWEQSKADAVEMESHVVQAICKEGKIPCATVRVILDRAEEDLPLNFNELMTPDQRLSYAKLMLKLLLSPSKIGALMKLQTQSRAAAEKLSSVLTSVLNLDMS